MVIISVSMDESALGRLSEAQRRLGFKSRSHLLRAAISSLMDSQDLLDPEEDHADAVFTIAYRSGSRDELGGLMRRYDDIISTEVHQHHRGTCLRVLILCGSGSRMNDFAGQIRKERGVRSLNVALLR